MLKLFNLKSLSISSFREFHQTLLKRVSIEEEFNLRLTDDFAKKWLSAPPFFPLIVGRRNREAEKMRQILEQIQPKSLGPN